MLSDDVFRERLERLLVELEAWAETTRDASAIDIAASARYWRMSVHPFAEGACPFEIMIKADQTFSLKLQDEVYEDRPLDRFDFFVRLVEAIAAGRVERIETFNALTGLLLAIEMRVELSPGWDWIGVRSVAPQKSPALVEAVECSTHRFLPYRR